MSKPSLAGPAPAGMNMTEAHSPLESACILPITSSSDPTSTCHQQLQLSDCSADRLQISDCVPHRHLCLHVDQTH